MGMLRLYLDFVGYNMPIGYVPGKQRVHRGYNRIMYGIAKQLHIRLSFSASVLFGQNSAQIVIFLNRDISVAKMPVIK